MGIRRLGRRAAAAISAKSAPVRARIADYSRTIRGRSRTIASEILELTGLAVIVFAAFEVHRLAGLFTLGAALFLYGVSMDPPSSSSPPKTAGR